MAEEPNRWGRRAKARGSYGERQGEFQRTQDEPGSPGYNPMDRDTGYFQDMPTYMDAPFAQYQSDAAVQSRRNRLWQDAHDRSAQATNLLQSRRAGGIAPLVSGSFQQQAGLYANEAVNQQNTDQMFEWRRHEDVRERRRAKRARTTSLIFGGIQAGTNILSAAMGGGGGQQAQGAGATAGPGGAGGPQPATHTPGGPVSAQAGGGGPQTAQAGGATPGGASVPNQVARAQVGGGGIGPGPGFSGASAGGGGGPQPATQGPGGGPQAPGGAPPAGGPDVQGALGGPVGVQAGDVSRGGILQSMAAKMGDMGATAAAMAYADEHGDDAFEDGFERLTMDLMLDLVSDSYVLEGSYA